MHCTAAHSMATGPHSRTDTPLTYGCGWLACSCNTIFHFHFQRLVATARGEDHVQAAGGGGGSGSNAHARGSSTIFTSSVRARFGQTIARSLSSISSIAFSLPPPPHLHIPFTHPLLSHIKAQRLLPVLVERTASRPGSSVLLGMLAPHVQEHEEAGLLVRTE